jgi:hypothetical protein
VFLAVRILWKGRDGKEVGLKGDWRKLVEWLWDWGFRRVRMN